MHNLLSQGYFECASMLYLVGNKIPISSLTTILPELPEAQTLS